jgi:hypothetical protein
MIADNGDKNEEDFDDTDDDTGDDTGDEDLDEDLDEDAMPDIGGETIIDLTGELNVDELVTGSAKTDPDELAHKREVRRRLEEIAERRNSDLLDDTFNFNLDDEF